MRRCDIQQFQLRFKWLVKYSPWDDPWNPLYIKTSLRDCGTMKKGRAFYFVWNKLHVMFNTSLKSLYPYHFQHSYVKYYRVVFFLWIYSSLMSPSQKFWCNYSIFYNTSSNHSGNFGPIVASTFVSNTIHKIGQYFQISIWKKQASTGCTLWLHVYDSYNFQLKLCKIV